MPGCRAGAGSSTTPSTSTRSRSTRAFYREPPPGDARPLARRDACRLPLRDQGPSPGDPHPPAPERRGLGRAPAARASRRRSATRPRSSSGSCRPTLPMDLARLEAFAGLLARWTERAPRPRVPRAVLVHATRSRPAWARTGWRPRSRMPRAGRAGTRSRPISPTSACTAGRAPTPRPMARPSSGRGPPRRRLRWPKAARSTSTSTTRCRAQHRRTPRACARWSAIARGEQRPPDAGRPSAGRRFDKSAAPFSAGIGGAAREIGSCPRSW